jgi:hypothetical protein
MQLNSRLISSVSGFGQIMSRVFQLMTSAFWGVSFQVELGASHVGCFHILKMSLKQNCKS